MEEGGAELCEGTSERVGSDGEDCGGRGSSNPEPTSWGRGGELVVGASAALAPLPHTSRGAGAMLANLSSCIYYY